MQLVVLKEDRSDRLILLESESADWENVHFVFGEAQPIALSGPVVHIRITPQGPVFSSNQPVQSMAMGSGNRRTVLAGRTITLAPYMVYSLGTIRFALEQFVPSARIEAIRPAEASKPDDSASQPDALVLEASVSGKKQTVSVFGLSGEAGRAELLSLGGADIGITYGAKTMKIPFELKLVDFRIDRYPGSMKPSGFASDVTIVDRERNVEKPYSIFMNHILRYRGYRFYQSSYDEDEMGTVLSVSRDPGMIPTYIGYVLLGLGLIFGLFRPKSRFRILGQNIKKAAKGTFFLLSVFTFFWSAGGTRAFDGTNSLGKQDNALCRRFAGVAVQDNGRIKPMHSLAKELIRSEKRLKSLSGINADQVGLWAFAFPEEAVSSGVFQNGQPEKMFRLFPVANDLSHRWVTVNEAGKRMDGEDKTFVLGWTDAYRKSVRENNQVKADSLITALEGFQATRGRDVFPGALRLKAEVFYNRADIFVLSASVLFWAGLLVLAGSILRTYSQGWIWKPVNAFLVVMLVAGFIFQTGGMGLRWFVSGHAPWTNKYESMVFISWSVMLAGMLFGLANRFMLAGAGILSGIFLYVAGMDWMDPKITTLPPVLRSIWLV
ncbi:MAG TPA: cytochrome c biogenesis protein ResB, partial [bacterium]